MLLGGHFFVEALQLLFVDGSLSLVSSSDSSGGVEVENTLEKI